MAAPVSSQPPAAASPGEVVRWAWDVINSHSVEPLRPYWTAETTERFPDGTMRGPDEIASYFEGLFAAVPDVHLRIVTLAEQGEDVFVHWHLTGTHTGAPFRGISATGKRVELDGMDHFVVRDGVIASNFVVFDQMQFARAIGLMPPDGSAADRGLKQLFNAKARFTRRRAPGAR